MPRELDPVVVDRLVRGHPTPSTIRERREAVRILTAHGISAAEIARRIGRQVRTVVRHRRALQVKAVRRVHNCPDCRHFADGERPPVPSCGSRLDASEGEEGRASEGEAGARPLTPLEQRLRALFLERFGTPGHGLDWLKHEQQPADVHEIGGAA